MYREPRLSSWPWVRAAVYIIYLSPWLSLLLSRPFLLCLLMVFSPPFLMSQSQTASNLSAPVSKPTKRYVCHTFTMAICLKRGPVVARDTSFKSPCWLIEFVYEAFIHCQTFDWEESSPSSVFPKSQHWARHACTCTETHTAQYSAEGSGTSCRQHPVPTEWLFCDKGQFGFFLARLPVWDLKASLTDLWPQVFVFFFLGLSLSSFLSPPPSLPRYSFFSTQVVCRRCPGNLAGRPADKLPPRAHPPTPVPSGQTPELALISPLSDTQAAHSLTCTRFTYTQWQMKQMH